MSFTLNNLTGYHNGVQADETGIGIKEFKLKVQPEIKIFAMAKDGTRTGFAVAPNEGHVTLNGEVKGTTGIMAAVPATATTFANSVSYFNGPSTGYYLDSAEVTQNREGGAWIEMNAEFSAYAGIP